ncbi:MAG: CCA tRNA nucleotidyltransferase [Acidobacteria bacterium]|nr:MAG: CCA tRNA nucleotidyltransferase [Acidobacteriota bacterium]
MGGLKGGNRPQPRTQLPAPLARALTLILKLARQRRETVFLVGGTSRDLLLGRAPLDLDLMVDGDALGLAAAFAAAAPARLTSHRRFATAVTHLPGGWRVDLAAPRRERYGSAGALPVVTPASPEEDLARRDFTINAMAWRWGRHGPGRLLDPTGGQEDLHARYIRILHPDSFQDDPSRAHRAVRLASRLGFRLEPFTARALGRSVQEGGPGLLAPARLGREIRLLAMEIDWPRAVRRAARAGLLSGDQGGLVPPPLAACRRLQRELSSRRGQETLPVILACMAMDGPGAGLGKLQLPGGVARRAEAILAQAQGLRRRLENLPRPPGSSRLADWALDLDEDALILAQACIQAGELRRALARFRSRRKGVHLLIDAGDLLAAGIPRGPELRQRLTATRRRRLAGDLKGRAAELAFASSPGALESRRHR